MDAQDESEHVQSAPMHHASAKHATKKLSRPCRDVLARSFVDETRGHEQVEQPMATIPNIVVKRVPFRQARETDASTAAGTTRSPRSVTFTRRIVTSPAKPTRASPLHTEDMPARDEGAAVVTHRIVTPVKIAKRVIVRKNGVESVRDHEGACFHAEGMPSGNRLSQDGAQHEKRKEETLASSQRDHESQHRIATAASSTPETPVESNGGPQSVVRRVIRRKLVQSDGSSGQVDRCGDAVFGHGMEAEGSALVKTPSFAGSVSSVTSDRSTSSRRVVTRRVVSAPGSVVRRTVVHKIGSSSGVNADVPNAAQKAESDNARGASGASLDSRHGDSAARATTRPQPVARRMIVRNGAARPGRAADHDNLDIDAKIVSSEDDTSCDESVHQSHRGNDSIPDRSVIPASAERVVSYSRVCSMEPTSQTQETTSTTDEKEEKAPIPSYEVLLSCTSRAQDTDTALTVDCPDVMASDEETVDKKRCALSDVSLDKEAAAAEGVVTKSQQPVECQSARDKEGDMILDVASQDVRLPLAANEQEKSPRPSLLLGDRPTDGAVVSSGKAENRVNERRTTELIESVESEIQTNDYYVEIASPRLDRCLLNVESQWKGKPCSLTWSSLRLIRKNSPDSAFVLDDVSGSVQAGEFLVVTGPLPDESRALLSCLAGFEFEETMEGSVTVNGREWTDEMNQSMAYIQREDLFYETLTVEEHLVAQAFLRMGRTQSNDMCLKRVEAVIADMGLTDCRDKLIGGGISIGGLSRGQRKLVALATALLTNPSILLVEEPTDGLDIFSAEEIVGKLRWLAFEKHLIVVATLHHPSTHSYELYDTLYLLVDASCVYDDKAANCIAYFATIGYQCPDYMSPIDFFLLQMAVGEDDELVARIDALKCEWHEHSAALDAARTVAQASEDAVTVQENRYYPMGCCGQLGLLWTRHLRRLSRYGLIFSYHVLAAFVMGVSLGLVYMQLDLHGQHGIQNFTAAYFYVVVVHTLLIAYRTFVFLPRELAVAVRERQEYRGKWYHLLCWYVTKLAAEFPALVVLSIALFGPVFLILSIGHGWKVYVSMQLVLILAGWATIGLAFVALGLLRHVTLAVIVYSCVLLLFVATSGFFWISFPAWLVWLQYLSPLNLSFEALMKIFWHRIDVIECDWTLTDCIALSGHDVLEFYGMATRSGGADALLLLAIGLCFFLVAFGFLLHLATKRTNGVAWRHDWTLKGWRGLGRTAVTSESKRIKQTGATKRTMGRKTRHSSRDGETHYICVNSPRLEGLGDVPKTTLSWSHVWQKDMRDEPTEYVLKDASGYATSGELVLLTGPSTAATRALLQCLGGLETISQGNVSLNGVVAAPADVSKLATYVPRVHFFYDRLTVEEHLHFHAQLVCGTATDARTVVDRVLDELDWPYERHALIESLSKVDTKLLALATALVGHPSILLVEDPTTDLDFVSAQYVVRTLRALARGNRAVLVTMAHPASHVFALVDTLYLVADGAAVYHGPGRDAVAYFASHGYAWVPWSNPMDAFLRLLTVRNTTDDKTRAHEVARWKDTWSTRVVDGRLIETKDERKRVAADALRPARRSSPHVLLLLRRHVWHLHRARASFAWHVLAMLVVSVVVGLAFRHETTDGTKQHAKQQDERASLLLILLHVLVLAARTFCSLPHDFAIIAHEARAYGPRYLVRWYLTKLVAELPSTLVLSCGLVGPAYVLLATRRGLEPYREMQLMLWLVSWNAVGVTSLVLALVRPVRAAFVLCLVLFTLFVALGGQEGPTGVGGQWLRYVCPVKYAYDAILTTARGGCENDDCRGGDDHVRSQDGRIRSHSVWTDGIVLCGMTLGCFGLAILSLVRSRRDRAGDGE
ncbi:hypothetical protein PsorP6_015534 [Peronosclerospora sorghi]|uniref:Uncharacterized protein n=1 Tax=Peronosclerospora sorghi TaxID=230839 RepID=A0ACC0WMD5_9STRA|nr:hypothetical protein PsorP6_015534 [Peronosclerospora sorghi]